jgi:exosortase A-associated hydrolase 1
VKVSEHPLRFDCAGEMLFGVLSLPATPLPVGVLVVVGGPQYRVGSHRQFVLLARSLAAAGHPVLRFDVRGMGDSTGEMRSFESLDDDIASALAALSREVPQVRRCVLWGLCDGASAALMYVQRTADPMVAGMCLVNPWVRSEATLARTQIKHYYGRRLLQREFWLKLGSGKVGLAALRGLAGGVVRALRSPSSVAAGHAGAPATYQQRMASAWHRFTGPMLLILSSDDYTAKEFLEYVASDGDWRGALALTNLRRRDVAGADHTFSGSASREEMERTTLAWLGECCNDARPLAHSSR